MFCDIKTWRSHLSYAIIIAPNRVLGKQLQPATMLPDLANLAHHAYRSLVLGVVLGAVKGAFLERCAAVDRCVASRADLELSKLVELDL